MDNESLDKDDIDYHEFLSYGYISNEQTLSTNHFIFMLIILKCSYIIVLNCMIKSLFCVMYFNI